MWSGVFEGSALENIKLPSTLKKIESCAFGFCTNLKSITLPDSLEYIGEGCFGGSALESISLHPALKTIEDKAFYTCENLKSV